eukprot:CAMPEP_0201566078 /NCGR_PEP_ID=MMETSP0190_2-20130828/5621_1 /ASSEMBLY_ACC=CAM_ASM_000263 /TAXON_ID=37353 /ORGANISM="Rosalina sp." /LENGTH=281 /DNA_ID=CAMNT_0047984321 /DNA_START=270 /DNA_END=1115 /DNA_ORIENTATION=+
MAAVCLMAAVLIDNLPNTANYSSNPNDSQAINETNTSNEAIEPIVASKEPHDEETAHYSVQSYDNDAVDKYVKSFRELNNQQRLKGSFNYILQNLYSKDDNGAVQRNVVKKKTHFVGNDEIIPEAVSKWTSKAVKKLNKDDTKDRETVEDAAQNVNDMVELGMKKYGDETQVIGLNTNVAGTSTFLIIIFATNKVSPTEREVDIWMIMEEWIVKDGYKINGACKDGDEMCWSNVRIQESLQYQLFSDYLPEIDTKPLAHSTNTTDCTVNEIPGIIQTDGNE